MSLINCPECKQQISSEAFTCPHCGYSIKPITIQQTDKTWKLLKLTSVLMTILGLILNFQTHGSGFIGIISFLLVLIGVISFIVSIIGKWWTNK